MVNAWSLLYDEIYGDDKMTDKKKEQPDPDGGIYINDAYEYADSIAVSGAGAGLDEYPYDQNFLADNDQNTSHHFTNIDLHCCDFTNDCVNYDGLNLNTHANSSYNMEETPSIKDPSNRKYKEDESIKALSEYISTTYGGHYTSEQNNVQTLDLIESVGDAEAFCRSNAIKYLSRYDKKGQAKRDILKALHYSLLLYHFSGQLNETSTRGYETF